MLPTFASKVNIPLKNGRWARFVEIGDSEQVIEIHSAFWTRFPTGRGPHCDADTCLTVTAGVFSRPAGPLLRLGMYGHEDCLRTRHAEKTISARVELQ